MLAHRILDGFWRVLDGCPMFATPVPACRDPAPLTPAARLGILKRFRISL
jgi:hypothetical protein